MYSFIGLGRSLYWRLYVILLSLRWVKKLNLGDTVIFQDKEYVLIQGVTAPLWTLASCDSKETVQVYETEFYKLYSFRNLYGSFKRGYRFYMGYWYKIWLTKGIEPWMRGCRIWGKPR